MIYTGRGRVYAGCVMLCTGRGVAYVVIYTGWGGMTDDAGKRGRMRFGGREGQGLSKEARVVFRAAERRNILCFWYGGEGQDVEVC